MGATICGSSKQTRDHSTIYIAEISVDCLSESVGVGGLENRYYHSAPSWI